MDEYEALMKLAFGNSLVLTLAREDFAVLKDTADKIEACEPLDEYEILELARVMSDLNAQAEKHFP